MRFRLEIDDQLIGSAMASNDFKTPKEAVAEGLPRIAGTRRKAIGMITAGGSVWTDYPRGVNTTQSQMLAFDAS